MSTGPDPRQSQRLAPNGKTVAENFQRWFEGSVLCHPDGRPKVLYHGSNQEISVFDMSWMGENTGSITSRIGFWLTDSPVVAADYAEQSARKMVLDSRRHEQAVAGLLKKAEKAETQSNWDEVERLYQEVESLEFGAIYAAPAGQNIVPVFVAAQRILHLDASDGRLNIVELIDKARDQGFDAVALENCDDCESGTISTHYCIFEPARIKSVFNNGNFDPLSEDLSDVPGNDGQTQSLGLDQGGARPRPRV